MIFPCMELFLVIIQVSYDFQSSWEPWVSNVVIYVYIERDERLV